jgi:inhibitor of KinA sporulation pathway (predicted exonuclease)
VRNGTHHNALDDARTQALHLIAINTAAGGIIL